MSGTHATIAPSSLARTVQCAFSVTASLPYLNEPATEEQQEGDAAHWVALQMSQGVTPRVGALAPNGVPVTDDMIDGGTIWADTVGPYGVAEVPVLIPRIHPTECWGTPDNRRWDGIDGVLRVFDYKFGHDFVEVFENWQTTAYASGILDTLELDGYDDQHVWVEHVIVQPRSYHADGPVRSWKERAIDLRARVNVAWSAAHAALAPNPEANTGPECIHCPARHECRTLQLAAGRIAEMMGRGERTNMPAAAVGVELTILDRAAELLDARRTGLKAQAEAMIRRGERVPGWAVEHGAGRLAWLPDAPVTELVGMGDVMGVDLRKPVALITPTQAKKLIDATVIDAYASRPKTAAKLVIDSTTAARKVFAK